MATIEEVKAFWEAHPLWTGESAHAPGSPEFFAEHARAVVNDGFAGTLDTRIYPPQRNRAAVLDLGCGPGFWTVELARLGCGVTAADLTESALALARKRCEAYGVRADFSQQNAESLTFADSSFSHVNCQGVIHHTPNTAACVHEIARVLRPGGTASLSVYFENALLRCWPVLRPVAAVLARFGAGMSGRGRETLLFERDVAEIVRLYDGRDNPVGKSYSRRAFVRLLEPCFVVEDTFLHFFPARSLPLRIPNALHRFLDRRMGFLIHAIVTKR